MRDIRLKAATATIGTGTAPQVNIVAYNGGLMTIEGFGPVVVDLQGLQIPESIPLCVDHDVSVDQTIGNGRATVQAGRCLVISGSLTRITAAAQHVIELNKIGNKLQASIGADVIESQKIREGEQIQANGRTIVAGKGGFTHITRAILFETSFVTYGADRTTSVSIAGSRVKGSIMSFEEWVADLGFVEVDLNEKQRNALMAAWQQEYPPDGSAHETSADTSVTSTAVLSDRRIQATEVRRVARLRTVCQNDERVLAAAIEQGWSAERAELEVFRRGQRKTPPSGHIRGSSNHRGSILECSALLSLGVPEKFLGKQYGEHVMNAAMARENRGAGMHTIINSTLQAAGRSTGWRHVDREAVGEVFEADRALRAAFSGGDVSGILSNIAGKLLLNSYQQIATTWNLFTGIQSAKNFKPFQSYMMTVKGALSETARGQSLDSLSLAESEFENKVRRRGAMISLTQEDMIDDDLNAFAAIPDAFGRLSAVELEKCIYKCLLANLATLFTTGHLNYFEGSDSALAIASLGVAEQKFLDQLDDNGNPMLLTPKLLGVPTKLSATSAVVCRDTNVQHPANISTAESVGNPHGGKFTPFVSPWFNNDNLEGADDDHWFLMAPPVGNQGIVNVAFLNGQQNPVIEKGDVPFDQLGYAWRVVFDFGVAPGDYRFGVRSKGKA